MSPSLSEVGNVWFTPIAVTADWSTAANAVTDIETKTGMDLSAPPRTVFFMLWEGEFDSDDVAVLKVAKTTGTTSWTDMYASAAAWDSAPTTDYAYIVGFGMTA